MLDPAAEVRKPREGRVFAVEDVFLEKILLVVVTGLQVMLLVQIEIQAQGRKVAVVAARVGKGEALQVRVGQLLNAALARRRVVNVRKQFPDHRINSRGLPPIPSQFEQVYLPHSGRGVVPENAILRIRTQDRPLPADLGGEPEFLVVDEEEGFVLPVEAQRAEEPLRQYDGAPHPEAELVEQYPVAWRFALLPVKGLLRRAADQPRLLMDWSLVAVIEPVIGVQRRVAMIFVKAAVELVIALAGDILDLDRALSGALRPRRGRRDSDFLNRVQARIDAAVEAVVGLVEIILDVDAVNGDVQGGLGEAIYGGITRRGRRVHPGQHGDEVTRIAGDEREVGDLFD